MCVCVCACVCVCVCIICMCFQVCVSVYVYLFVCVCVLCVFIIVCCFTADVFLLCVRCMRSASTITTHTRAHSPPTTHIFTAPSSHIHLNTVTADYTHTCTYRIMLHPHTGANGGDLQRGEQKDPYIVLKTLKLLLREWAKDLNAPVSIEKRSYQVKREAGCLCIVCVHVCGMLCDCVCIGVKKWGQAPALVKKGSMDRFLQL